MESQEGIVLWLFRGFLSACFWVTFLGAIGWFLKSFFQERGFQRLKQDFIQLAITLNSIVKLAFQKLSYKLRKQYRILQINFKSYENSLQIVRAVFIIIFEQVVRTAIQTMGILSQFIIYLKQQGQKKQANPKKALATLLEKSICSISNKLMKQPTLLSECGHTFDKQSLDNLNSRKRQCPICKTQFNKINMKKNYHLEELIVRLSQESKQQLQQRQGQQFSLPKTQETPKFLYIIIIFLILYSMWPSSSTAAQSSPQTFKSAILKKYNHFDENFLSIEEFNKNRDKFMQLLNFKDSGEKFTIYRNNAAHQMEVSAKIVKSEKFITEICLNGQNEKGSWAAEGFFMTKTDGLYFWMLITEIQNEDNHQKYENDLIFESYVMKMPISSVSGKWYYLGQMTNPLANGQWKLSIKSQLLGTPKDSENNEKSSKTQKVTEKQLLIEEL